MEKAEQLCDEILLINDGRVILEGSLEAIRGQFSENIVDFAYTGDTTFINDFAYVDKVIGEAGKVQSTSIARELKVACCGKPAPIWTSSTLPRVAKHCMKYLLPR
jgi:ABC-type uncharacterized transport system ATPase subunit